MTTTRESLLEELLVLRCREGSREAFELLVRRWQPRLLRHAWRLTGREDAAQDVVQEVWMAVARGLPRLGDSARFRPWIYTIATRRAADWRRRRGLRERVGEEVGDARELPAPSAGEDGAVARLRDGLRRLPREQRALLALRYTEELELREIAEILGVPEGTVKSRLHGARERLRAILESKP